MDSQSPVNRDAVEARPYEANRASLRIVRGDSASSSLASYDPRRGMSAQPRGEAILRNLESPRLASWKSENLAVPRRGDLEFLESERGEARRFSLQIGGYEARQG